jgi:hypothetical protein
MENEIKLSRDSSSEELKRYFTAILELNKSGEEFPVDLDDVWMLAYGRKDAAITALRTDEFYEGSDYIASQNQKVVNINELTNGIKTDVKLSVSCLEYLIARKVRSVFEVYRQVFHKVARPMSQLEILQSSVNALVEHENRISEIERRLDDSDRERKENTEKLLALPVSGNKLPEQSMKSKIRELVNAYASVKNISQQDTWHRVYKDLYYIHGISINSYKKNDKKESKLAIAERHGFLGKVYDIASNLTNEIGR